MGSRHCRHKFAAKLLQPIVDFKSTQTILAYISRKFIQGFQFTLHVLTMTIEWWAKCGVMPSSGSGSANTKNTNGSSSSFR